MRAKKGEERRPQCRATRRQGGLVSSLPARAPPGPSGNLEPCIFLFPSAIGGGGWRAGAACLAWNPLFPHLQGPPLKGGLHILQPLMDPLSVSISPTGP